ncbi:MAG: hypothetical protein L3J63_03515 [Geopsychrobacter sp.]|nr:hypothetical protein [Geopsychrobacter sp.]
MQEKLPAHLVLDATNQHAIVGSMPIWGQAVDIEIVKGKAYVVSSGEGVRLFNLIDPVNPEAVGHLSGGASAWRADADENYLYLSSQFRGVSILKLDNLQSALPGINTTNAAKNSIHRDSFIFIANGKNGVSVYDISKQGADRHVGQLALPGNTTQLALFDRFLVAASNFGGLHLIDIHQPAHLNVLQSVKAQKKYENVTVVDQYLYASDGDARVDIFSLAQGRLQKISSFQIFGNVRDFLRAENFLYIAESSYGVSKLDIRDPVHPRRVGFVGTPGEPGGLGLYLHYLYVASMSQGVQIVDTERFEPRNYIGAIDTPSDAFDLVVDEGWIYVADGMAGLQVIDGRDLKHLKNVAQLATDYSAKSLIKNGNIIYLLLKKWGLSIIDISDPRAPRQIGFLKSEFRISSLAIQGTTLFAGSYDKKLLAIDISSPGQPWVTQVLDLPDKIREIAVHDEYVFMAAENSGLLVASFAPGQPGRMVAALQRPWPMSEFSAALGITIRGDYAYLVQGEEGFQIIDIKRPGDPRVIGSFYHSGRSLGVEVTDNYAVLSTRWDGFSFVDISDPEHPYLAAHIDSPRSTRGFKLVGDKLYASGRTNGISVLPFPLKKIFAHIGKGLTLTFPRPQHPGWYALSLGGGEAGEVIVTTVEID